MLYIVFDRICYSNKHLHCYGLHMMMINIYRERDREREIVIEIERKIIIKTERQKCISPKRWKYLIRNANLPDLSNWS